MLAALLGINPAQEADIKGWVRGGGFQALAENLQCASDNLSALRQLSEREYGMPHKPENAVSFNVRKRPAMPKRVVSGTEPLEFDLETELGKPVTRGHIKSRADSEAIARVFFGVKDGATKVVTYGDDYYELEPSSVLDFSWEFDTIKVVSDDGGIVNIQILAQ
jgi:hypothetical protein